MQKEFSTFIAESFKIGVFDLDEYIILCIHELGMTPDSALDSNPLATYRRIGKLREAKNPDLKKKESSWTRKEVLEIRRSN